MNMEDYEKLAAGGAVPDGFSDEQIAYLLSSLGQWVQDALITYDDDLVIRIVNPAAESMLRCARSELVGKRLDAAMPEIGGSLVLSNAERTARSNQYLAADIPSPFLPDRWLNLRTYPWQHLNMLVIRDITREVRDHRLADVKQAILEAMRAHGDIGYIRCTMRGTIDKVEGAFEDLTGLTPEKLVGQPVVNLLDRSSKPRMRDAMEEVMRGKHVDCITLDFLTNHGDVMRARTAMVQLNGTYGGEGLILVLTPEPADS